MKPYNWIDLVLGVILFVQCAKGFRSGLVKSILEFIGFVVGAIGAVFLALKLVHDWNSAISKIGLLIVAVFVCASLGQRLLGRLGKVIHQRILFQPLKLVDSIAGGALNLLKVIAVTYLVSALLLASNWSWATTNLPKSRVVSTIERHVPNAFHAIVSEASKRIKAVNLTD